MYRVDEDRYERFDERNVIFARSLWDQTCSCYGHEIDENLEEIITQGKSGYSRFDAALYLASWTIYNTYEGAFSWKKLSSSGGSPGAYLSVPLETSPLILTAHIKRAAQYYGAALVGIGGVDSRWIYSHDRKGNPITIPDHFTSAIVMAVQMDPIALATTPALLGSAATGMGYSKMAFLIACLGEFIRNLGYGAIQMGNDTALSIPLAIDAGLGELGRHGLLITPQYGSRIRICKIFTDMPLVKDHPRDFGIQAQCKHCSKCAEVCEVGAISSEHEPTFDPVCPSNNPGVLKWPIDAEKCYGFWCENGGDCSTCITACPFTRKTLEDSTPDTFWKV
jgi:ferredoxin